MHSIDSLGSLVLAVLVFQLIPGPGTLAILRTTAQHGMRAGFASVSGTLLGGLLCMLAAASGLEAVFRGHPQALHLLQAGGAVYLGWMGCRLMRPAAAAAPAGVPAAPGWACHCRQALAVSLTNPKVILFYFALLPLFFRAPVTAESLATMVGCVSGISLLYQAGLVLAGHAAARRLGRLPSLRRLVQRAAGVALIGFAIRLLWA
ncbi:LysE family translocator [Aquincola sp. J276]|uniref:LysE family translocator n=1 Tax=Aquincola sp. J276 TaxID=2898432 RepID=UPI0021506D78|nr:LysE family translocator [Aquincola sp. J276]MCR5867311.1 LysE family translocator [Aquincola sp. J276]